MTETSFAQAPAAFRPLVFWFWNGAMDDSVMRSQLASVAAEGFGGFYIHPMLGLEHTYLSEAFFAKVRTACLIARDLGLEVWIYDEYGWPSSVAGGFAVSDRADLRCRHIRYHRQGVGGTSELHIADNTEPVTQAWLHMPSGASGAPSMSGRSSLEFVDLSAHITDDALHLAAASCGFEGGFPDGTDLIYFTSGENKRLSDNSVGASWAPLVGAYLDTLNPRAVRRFIDLTHERYKSAIGDLFGTTVKGFFTDEPSVNGQSSPECLPWSSSLPAEFRRDHGYDIAPMLPHLVLPGAHAQVKIDYWSTVGRLYTNSYHAQVREWLEANGLVYTGHLLEDNMWQHVHECGDVLALKQMHWPGIDHLQCRRDFASGNAFNVKLVSAISELVHAERLPCETGGVSDWGTTMADVKATCDWLIALGVNQIGLMGLLHTMAGMRPDTYSPTYGPQSPWWKHMGLLSDHIARLCWCTTQGEHRPHVAVLYPTSSIRAAVTYGNGDTNPDWGALDPAVTGAVNDLIRAQLDVTLVFEETLSDPTALAGSGLRTLVVPDLFWLCPDAMRAIAALEAGGTSVVRLSARGPVPEALLSLRDLVLVDERTGEPARDVVIQRRELPQGAGTLYCAYNAATEPLTFRAPMPIRIWHTGSGEVTEMRSGGTVTAASQAAMVFTTSLPHAATGSAASDPVPRHGSVELAGPWGFELGSPNTYALRDWAYVTSAGELRADGDIVPGALLDDERLVIRNTFSVAGGGKPSRIVLEGAYTRWLAVNGCVVTTAEAAVAHPADTAMVSIDIAGLACDGPNTVEMDYAPPAYERRVHNDNWFRWYPAAARPRVFVEGDFAVVGEELSAPTPIAFPWGVGTGRPPRPTKTKRGTLAARPTHIALGPWTDAGFPYFSGIAVYSTDFVLTADHPALAAGQAPHLLLAGHRGVVEVTLNGAPLDTAAWEPYTFNTRRLLRAGSNALRISVTNTIKNRLMGPEPSGLEWARLTW